MAALPPATQANRARRVAALPPATQAHRARRAAVALVNDERFAGLPMVLETPKGDDLADDVRNLATLRSLCNGQSKPDDER